ncbi:MAG: 2-phospho-L-lactate transferase [Candidatus Bathyarchaeota archaeon]
MITVLAGGVGAARFLQGLMKIVPEEEVTIIGNTGDDIDLYGLHISPDLDIVMYTLAGIVNEGTGYGIRGDTFHCLEALNKYGCETWFKLGDRDFATHIHRTYLLKKALKLSEATDMLCRALGLKVKMVPMTDDRLETRIVTESGSIHFQEYLVKRGARDNVLGVEFKGVEDARPAPGVVDSIMDAEEVIICPSNPVVSIGTILAVKGIREALKRSRAKKVAISPLIAGAPVKGPADKLMRGLGLEASAFSVANLYKDFLDTFILDKTDSEVRAKIERLQIRVLVTNTIMKSLEDKVQLAKVVLEDR